LFLYGDLRKGSKKPQKATQPWFKKCIVSFLKALKNKKYKTLIK